MCNGESIDEVIAAYVAERSDSEVDDAIAALAGARALRVTNSRRGTQLITWLRSIPLTWEEISKRTGIPVRTLRNWHAPMPGSGHDPR